MFLDCALEDISELFLYDFHVFIWHVSIKHSDTDLSSQYSWACII